MLNYNEYKIKRKAIENKRKEYRKKNKDLGKEKLKLRLDQFNKARQEIVNKMNKFVAGSSNYN